LLAFGLVLHAVAEIALPTALLGAACFITCYTLLGGLLADVYTDLIQGSVVAIGLGILTFVLVQQAGGVAEAWQGIDSARLRFTAAGEGWLERLDGWAIPILGSLVAQEALSRILATRDTRVATRACYVAGGIYFVIGMMPVIAGLIGNQVWPKVAAGDHYILELAEATLSPMLYVIFAGALLSAILSTIDSTLLSVSAMVERNLLCGFDAVGARPHTPLWLARACVLGSGIFAYLLASGTERIYTLLEQASSFGSAGILVTTLAGLYSRKGGALTAALTLITGAALMLLGEQLGWPAPYLTAVAGSLLCYILAFSAEKSLLFVKLFPKNRA
jgi:Na+/proline symporter